MILNTSGSGLACFVGSVVPVTGVGLMLTVVVASDGEVLLLVSTVVASARRCGSGRGGVIELVTVDGNGGA